MKLETIKKIIFCILISICTLLGLLMIFTFTDAIINAPNKSAETPEIVETEIPEAPFVDPDSDTYINVTNAKKVLKEKNYSEEGIQLMSEDNIMVAAYDGLDFFEWDAMPKYQGDSSDNPEFPKSQIQEVLNKWYGYYLQKEYEPIIEEMEGFLEDFNFNSFHQKEMTSLYHDALQMYNGSSNGIEVINSIAILKNSKCLILSVTTHSPSITEKCIIGTYDDIPMVKRIQFLKSNIVDDMTSDVFNEYFGIDPLGYKFEEWDFRELRRGDEFRVIIGVRIDGTKKIIKIIPSLPQNEK